MDCVSGVLSSVKQWVFDPCSKEKSCPSGSNGSLLLNRSVKCLALGGLAVSLGAIEGVAEKTVGVARFSGNVPTEPANSCMQGVIVGGVGSLLVQNPLPLLMGLGECLPKASAQQRVGNEVQVNTYTVSDQKRSSVSSLSNGNFIVVWQSYGQDGSYDGVYGQLFDENSTRIGNEFQVNSYTSNYQDNPSIASFSNGNFVVTWDSYGQDGQHYGVYGQLFDVSSNRISSEFQINTYTADWQHYSSAASFSNGNFVVTWHSAGHQDGSGRGVYGQLFDGNASRIGNEFQVNTYTNGHQYNSCVVSFSNGNFVVTWESEGQDGSYAGVYGQLFYGNGTKLGSEFQVSTYATNDQDDSSVASFSNDNFVVIWESDGQDGSMNGVYGQLFYGNGTRLRSEFQVSTYTANEQDNPSVAIFSNGNFVVTWQSNGQDGSGYGIYGQLFDENATRIGNEFQVNNYTTDDQQRPSVTSFSNGDFVVAWQSLNQDGSNFGVYGQLFEGPLTSSTIRTTSEMITSSSSSIRMNTSSINESVSSSTLIADSSSISSTKNSDSNIGLILGIIAGVGGGCGIIVLTYLYLNRRKSKNRDEVALKDLENEEKITYANAPKKPDEEQYANYPEGAREDSYANMQEVKRKK